VNVESDLHPDAAASRSVVARAAAGVVEARERMAVQRAAGSPGTQICTLASDLFETIVLDVYHTIVEGLPAETAAAVRREVAVVAHGGFGRREMAPYSDVDVMLLYERDPAGVVPGIASQLLQDLFDAGLDVGQSVRTVPEAIRLAERDATVFSTLIESRLIAGPGRLLDRLRPRLALLVERHRSRLLRQLIEARGEERDRHGRSASLLQPNVKRSPGGLRDIQMVRWIGFLGWGEATFSGLVMRNALSRADADALREARSFLLGVRIDLHLAAGRGNDELSRDEQARIATERGIESSDGLLGVERFMRDYCGVTQSVLRILTHIQLQMGPSPWRRRFADRLLGHSVDGEYCIGPRSVAIWPQAIPRVVASLPAVMRLVLLSMRHDRPISEESWEAVRLQLSTDDASQFPDDESQQLFLQMFTEPTRLADALRAMHRVGLLERFIPAFEHARGLLQFNNYHKFTVDEHSLHTVERGIELADDAGWLGNVWRGIRRRRPLLLALLLHDIGKGRPGDHSEVGALIAREVATDLGLPEDEAEIVELLVAKHLVMAHLAFRRNVGDQSLVVGFARDVGSPEVLRMLTILTVADVTAVGPGMWTGWKADLLSDLYERTLACLDGESLSRHVDRRRAELDRLLAEAPVDERVMRLADRLTPSYLQATEPGQMVEELERVVMLPPGELFVLTRWHDDTKTVGVTFAARKPIIRGVFHRVTGALSSLRLAVLSADIHSFDDEFVIDHFVANDPDSLGQPPASRMQDIERAIENTIRHGKRPSFQTVFHAAPPPAAVESTFPTRVRIDNASSDTTTIIEVFAHDRTGLLYAVARAIYEAGLSVKAAKIGTYLDQVVDAFHVTEQDGSKVDSPDRRRELCSAIESVLQAATDGTSQAVSR
jgi:[protein-PII] uridylyltransferase